MANRIDFARVEVIVMQIGSPGILPQVLITWTIEPVRRGISQLRFKIERSESPSFDDPLDIETVSPTIPGIDNTAIYEFLDITVNRQSFWRKYYYRIVVNDTVPNTTFYSPIKTWESELKVFETEIVSRHDWLLKYETGVPCFALVERTTGTSCLSCFNKSLNRPTKSNCPSCYGTGKERPYYYPILTFVDFNPSPNVTQIQMMGEVQTNQTNIMWSAFPVMKPRDLLVEVMSGDRWRVLSINPVGDVHTTIQHFARVEQVNQRDVEYQIPIPLDVQKAAAAELDLMKKERRF